LNPIRRTIVVLCAVGLPALAPARAPEPAPILGVVTKVIDGDTIALTPQGQPMLVVRLRDIDAPELCQPWGEESKRALVELALNKMATVQTRGRDARGRTVGVVWVEDVNVGVRLVEDGNAWSTRTRWDQGPLVKQERMAKALHRGLHAAGDAVSPSEFRRAHGPCVAGAAVVHGAGH
jgi:endonuclease YncB( thermonuclease family)